jgi:hypothetical protein
LAAQLGVDVATYRLLLQLEQRDIRPEDYDLLGRLDDAVRPATLSLEEVQRFPIETYLSASAPAKALEGLASASNAICDFAVDFWRLPLPSCDGDEEDGLLPPSDDDEEDSFDCRCCFGSDFWRLPLPALDDELQEEELFDEDRADAACDSMCNVCGVCLADFEDGDELRVLPCSHRFHKECIDHWLLESSPACPVDKRDLRSPKED